MIGRPGQQIIVIEPHADDAFLSLGGHITGWVKQGIDVLIVTVYGDRTRSREAAVYAAAVGASALPLGLPEGGGGNGKDWVAAPLPSFPSAVAGEESALRLWPLGIRHPEHRAVAAAAPPDAYRYVEQPYADVTRNSEEVSALLAGRPVLSWLRPHGRKYRHTDVFRSQRLFMHYNGESIRHTPEVIVGCPFPIGDNG